MPAGEPRSVWPGSSSCELPSLWSSRSAMKFPLNRSASHHLARPERALMPPVCSPMICDLSFSKVGVGVITSSTGMRHDLIVREAHFMQATLCKDADHCPGTHDNEIEVSVVMPCLNEARTVGKCVAKALGAFRAPWRRRRGNCRRQRQHRRLTRNCPRTWGPRSPRRAARLRRGPPGWHCRCGRTLHYHG